MKKIILAFTICFLFYLNINQEIIVPTANITDDYNFYILEFPNQNVSTNNFNKYFAYINVIWIEPYINPLFNVKTRYQFKNINYFKEQYINLLIEKGYRKFAMNLKIEGIKIKRIKVYSSDKTISNLKIENIKFDIIYN